MRTAFGGCYPTKASWKRFVYPTNLPCFRNAVSYQSCCLIVWTQWTRRPGSWPTFVSHFLFWHKGPATTVYHGEFTGGNACIGNLSSWKPNGSPTQKRFSKQQESLKASHTYKYLSPSRTLYVGDEETGERKRRRDRTDSFLQDDWLFHTHIERKREGKKRELLISSASPVNML